MGAFGGVKLLPVLLLLSLPAMAKTCHVEGLARVVVPESVDCAAFVDAFEFARGELPYLTHLTEAQVAAKLQRVHVEVLPRMHFKCGGDVVVGCWQPGCRRILVGPTAGALLHEFLHVLEPNPVEFDHVGWEANGWNAAEYAYWSSAVPLSGTPPPPPSPPLQSNR